MDYFNEGMRLSFDERNRYVEQHRQRILKEIEKFAEEELLEIEFLLNGWNWDESKLGTFRNALEGYAYWRVIFDYLGRYKTLKYFYIKKLGKTEEEFREFIISSIVEQCL